MIINDYHTAGGKNVIMDHIQKLPIKEKAEALAIRQNIETDGIEAFEILSTRQLYKKLYEIKFSQQRIMYVIKDTENVYFLHMCKKEKKKAKTKDLDVAKKRAKEQGLL